MTTLNSRLGLLTEPFGDRSNWYFCKTRSSSWIAALSKTPFLRSRAARVIFEMKSTIGQENPDVLFNSDFLENKILTYDFETCYELELYEKILIDNQIDVYGILSHCLDGISGILSEVLAHERVLFKAGTTLLSFFRLFSHLHLMTFIIERKRRNQTWDKGCRTVHSDELKLLANSLLSVIDGHHFGEAVIGELHDNLAPITSLIGKKLFGGVKHFISKRAISLTSAPRSVYQVCPSTSIINSNSGWTGGDTQYRTDVPLLPSGTSALTSSFNLSADEINNLLADALSTDASEFDSLLNGLLSLFPEGNPDACGANERPSV